MADLRSQISDRIQEARTENREPKRLRIAIVCDWLTGTGGAERVVLELHHLFPEAPIYTSQYNRNPKIWFGDKWFENADVRTGWLQKIPKSLKKFLPLFRAWYFSRLNLDDYDLVISSSGAEAKFVKRLKPGALHISYCHSPTHYYWARYDEYLMHPGFGLLDPLARLALRLLVGPMRRWDYRAAQRPGYFVANSRHTKKAIKQYYGREAEIVHPPVDVERFAGASQPAAKRHGFITAGRQTPYKRFDLPVAAATQTHEPLVVIGRGPDHGKLKKMASRNVTFLSEVSDNQMPELFGGAKAFIMPNADDFGIVAVEALAAGTPVIAYHGGGALDYVTNQTGVFFEDQTSESLVEAFKKLSGRTYDYAEIQSAAAKFSAANFRRRFQDYLKSVRSGSDA